MDRSDQYNRSEPGDQQVNPFADPMMAARGYDEQGYTPEGYDIYENTSLRERFPYQTGTAPPPFSQTPNDFMTEAPPVNVQGLGAIPAGGMTYERPSSGPQPSDMSNILRMMMMFGGGGMR